MNNTPGLDALKAQARRLRQSLAENGTEVSHSRSLELLAQSLGARDWNTLHARLGNAPPGWQLGQKVRGVYLGHAVCGRIHALSALADGWYRLELALDEPVDVIASEHFSSLRRRIRATVGPDGETVEKTSDGKPHLRLTA
tara:strand:- start:3112 stop:3534 length:423 start_codon:yes stop_codon:yes gene_type:complete